MAIIYNVNIPYQKFEIGQIADPSETNANNGALQSKINEVANAVNNIKITDPSGDLALPSYIKETYIDPVELRSPLITGNSLIGAGGIVGLTSIGDGGDSVRIWAGSSDRTKAPFRVTQDGAVTMTKANIETVKDGDGKYITMSGSKITGGRLDQDSMYTIGTGALSSGSSAGIFRSNTFLAGSSVVNYTMDVLHNTVMVKGSNLVLGGSAEFRPVVISGKVAPSHHALAVPAGAALHVNGSINLTGDIYVNGVKMQLTPAV